MTPFRVKGKTHGRPAAGPLEVTQVLLLLDIIVKKLENRIKIIGAIVTATVLINNVILTDILYRMFEPVLYLLLGVNRRPNILFYCRSRSE